MKENFFQIFNSILLSDSPFFSIFFIQWEV